MWGELLVATERLSARFVRTVKEPGRYCDGRGLYLDIGTGTQRSWSLRFMLNGRSREMGLGSAHDLSLADAREKAAQLRKQKANGIDPLAAKQAAKAVARAAEAKVTTFRQAAEQYIAAHRASWRTPASLHQWQSSLAAYAFPVIGDLSVAMIDTGHVLKVLEPIWTTKTETASRVRNRIELIFNWCTVRQFRSGENPARWRGHLSALLPKPSKVRVRGRHAALPYQKVPEFLRTLGDDAASKALGFIVLTAARLGEVVGADWKEIDLETATWIVPEPA